MQFRKLFLTLVLSSVLSTTAAAQASATNAPNQKPQPNSNAGGQQSAPGTSPQTSSVQSRKNSPQSEQETEKQEQSKRILGVVPQFGMTNRQDAPPLTTGQKFHLFVKSSFDPFAYAAAGLQAGLGQATNEFPGYGQGAAGYGKRYGASLADQVSSNFFSNFLYPSILKEDPRYFRLGEGSTGHRIL